MGTGWDATPEAARYEQVFVVVWQECPISATLSALEAEAVVTPIYAHVAQTGVRRPGRLPNLLGIECEFVYLDSRTLKVLTRPQRAMNAIITTMVRKTPSESNHSRQEV